MENASEDYYYNYYTEGRQANEGHTHRTTEPGIGDTTVTRDYSEASIDRRSVNYQPITATSTRCCARYNLGNATTWPAHHNGADQLHVSHSATTTTTTLPVTQGEGCANNDTHEFFFCVLRE